MSKGRVRVFRRPVSNHGPAPNPSSNPLSHPDVRGDLALILSNGDIAFSAFRRRVPKLRASRPRLSAGRLELGDRCLSSQGRGVAKAVSIALPEAGQLAARRILVLRREELPQSSETAIWGPLVGHGVPADPVSVLLARSNGRDHRCRVDTRPGASVRQRPALCVFTDDEQPVVKRGDPLHD